jgi:hypothetical protein
VQAGQAAAQREGQEQGGVDDGAATAVLLRSTV